MMNQTYSYPVSDGRTAICRTNLAYAMNNDGEVLLSALSEKDAYELTLVENPQIAKMLQLMLSDGAWRKGGLKSTCAESDADCIKNYCIILSDGTICIRNGSEYVPVEQFMANASEAELQLALRMVAGQAALAQLVMAQRTEL